MGRSLLFLVIFALTIGCVSQHKYDTDINKANADISTMSARMDSLQTILTEQSRIIAMLQDSITLLSYPASQRYNYIISLVKVGNLDEAKNEIAQLKYLFPKSTEAEKCTTQEAIIKKKEAILKAEQERIKALGFKALKDNLSITVNDEKSTFSSFSFGRDFTFDYCDDVNEYWYRTADKNNTYILASLTLSTKKNYATPPTMIACEIINGKLRMISYFSHEYASWSSYGAKIGNYRDDSHNFSKVNAVRYKIASEISLEQSKKPIVVVVPKEGKKYKDGISAEDVNEELHVIKIINRDKI